MLVQRPGVRLYFYWRPNCPYCEAAEPDLARFQQLRPDVPVFRLNADAPSPISVLGFEPEVTPTYVLQGPRGQAIAVGRRSARDLVKWVQENGA